MQPVTAKAKGNNRTASQILLLVSFSIAMGLLEAVVAVYLRMLYYPEGFHFPLKLFSTQVYRIEVLRELATLIMLGSISILVGKNKNTRLAYFLLTFAIWDIFYYAFLKLLLGWPATLLDWDILFLIPITWVGPVLSAIICSIVMLLISFLILYFDHRGKAAVFKTQEWILILTGSLVIFYTFIRDYALLIISTPNVNDQIQQRILQYIPNQYQWLWFWVGIGLIIVAIILWAKRTLQRP